MLSYNYFRNVMLPNFKVTNFANNSNSRSTTAGMNHAYESVTPHLSFEHISEVIAAYILQLQRK